ncbi:MAG TPA: c-type cytochrome, partial [Flavisolibacter sp.]
MKKIIISLSVVALVTTGSIIACNSDKNPSKLSEGIDMPEPSSDDLVKKGQYLVTIMGCNDCHSPKVMTPHGPKLDSSRLLSGHPESMPVPEIERTALKSWVLFNHNLTAFAGPWGVSFAANLTSDETGIGNWTESQFFKAMREGRYKGMDNTRPMLPPMPWEMFSHATDEDLRAIFAYLKSTPPVNNRV